jgi:hypothetical protein
VPNRLLREGICSSDAINSLTADEEVFFYRLLVVSDDYGHMDGRTAILKAQCFPLKDSATTARIEQWLAGLVSKGMLARYTANGRPFLAILKWEARVRTHPKYPLPSDEDVQRIAAVCAQPADRLLTDDSNVRLGLGLGKGMGASNDVTFNAEAGSFAVPDLVRSQWDKAYPAVDVQGELAKAAAWLIANPRNAKSNYARFLTNWLTKAQDKAPARGGGQQSSFAGAV